VRRRGALAALCAAGLACSDTRRPPPVAHVTEPSDVDVLREHVAREPGDSAAWFHLADLYERAGLYPEEVEALRKVLALDPAMAYAHLKLGNAYNRLGDHPAAVESLLRAEKTIKNQPVLYNNLGVSYGRVGRSGDELTALRKAIALRPRYATAHFNLGMALLARGDRAAAAEECRVLDGFDEGAAASLRKEIDARGRSR